MWFSLRRWQSFAATLFAAATLSTCPIVWASAYDGTPKLVIILVFDQMRGDYLERYRADFHTKNGWNLFLKQGAQFTDCYYDYANLITAAGHSTIGTASYTDAHQVPLNEWWEPGLDGKLRLVTSVQDDRYTLVGVPAGQPSTPGASPKNEMASTLGDELRLATSGKARVYGVSFKDRASILTVGHSANAAFWTDKETGAWITSTYYARQLPAWAAAFNASDQAAKARQASGVASGSFYEAVGRTPASVQYQLDFARALIDGEHLGHNPDGVSDLMTLSISSTDLVGHSHGPESAESRAMIDAADVQLDSFFTWLDSYVGLSNVMIGLTGDHGVAATETVSQALGMPGKHVPIAEMTKYAEVALRERFPQIKDKHPLVLSPELPWVQLDPAPFMSAGIDERSAEDAMAEAVRNYFAEQRAKQLQLPVSDHRLPEPDRLQFIYTATDLREGRVPNTDLGRRELHSYSPVVRWAVHMNYGVEQYPGAVNGAGHYSQNAYDRHVPLGFYGSAFIRGTYHQQVQPVDIAATFASLLRINQPSQSVGHVLHEVIRDEMSSSLSDRHRTGK